MKADVLERSSGREVAVLLVGLVLSIAVHLAVALSVSAIPPREKPKPVWVEMAVNVKPPPKPPEPPPPPPVQPDPPKPKPEPVKKFKDIPPPPPPDQPPPPPPPPDAKPPPRVVQGLSASSFSVGAGTGLTVRAGTTTATRAGETMGLDQANQFATVPFASVEKPPKIKSNPPLEVPQEVIDQGVEGRVEVEVTIDPNGLVTDVTVVSGLMPAADAACVAHAKKTRWTPYTKDGTPAAVKGVPFSCRFEKVAG